LKNRKQNLVIKNATDSKAELYIYNDIVSDEYEAYWTGSDVYPDAVKQFLDNVKGKDLDVYINSNGGSVMSALAIFNMLSRHIEAGNTVTTYVDGIAASSASFIAMIGVQSGGLYVPENSFIMVHRAWVQTWGNSEQLRDMANTLDKIDEVILSIYEKCLKDGVDIATIKELVDKESYISGKEAANYFNIITTSPIEVVACVSDIKHKNIPDELLKRVSPKENETNESEIHNSTEKDSLQNENEIENLLLEIDLI